MTEHSFVSQSAGPIVLGVELPVGRVHVQVLDSLTTARVVVRTDDSSGPAADAVRRARSSQNGQALAIEVPEVPGNVITQSFDGNRITQTINTVHGTVTSMTIIDGRVVAGGPTGVLGVVSPIEIRVALPVGSSLAVVSQSADAIVRGSVDQMEFRSVSGDLRVDVARSLNAKTTSGDVAIGRVMGPINARSVCGDISVGLYGGPEAELNSTSGDVSVRVAEDSTGPVRVSSVSGDIRVVGGRGRVNARSVSGRVRTS
ncbi:MULTISPECIES: DUF4097 family beta strand repeat-containing protein [Streptomyces]|uniref:DUF4097 family beta strand repeat protein n=1 Tax=Streptomyces griseocarneus TaxID=51201 RepID=A0ABX7RPJ1_9ACTN|nr:MULTISPECIES: DUF4097 family beta strand repeat-containing protein [Streptomyces]QSY50196.1 DUF4097 family beta strand repeat protein [Streptomyces griseocarneus]